MLKLKIRAIIDNAGNHIGYNILPVIFIYRVLRDLKDKYDIKNISLEQLYTYVMTCDTYDKAEQAVKYIYTNAPIISPERLHRFKDFSRILNVIENISLFNINNNGISINSKFDDYFYNNFLSRFDLESLHNQLARNVDYSYFLYSYQGFDINLIDEPINIIKKYIIYETKEDEYQNKVDKIKENNINEYVANESYKIEPVISVKSNIAAKFERNPLLGKIAIKKVNYLCEINHNHKTFISKSTQKPYMEAHHFVPVANQKEAWERYNINIDCIENIISLCPTCHKAFHYGTDKVKNEYIEYIYKKIVYKYNSINFNITIDEIKAYYGIYNLT